MAGITPLPAAYLNSLSPVTSGTAASPTRQEGLKAFSDYLKDAVDNIEYLDAVKQEDAYNLAIGDVDDIGSIGINSYKYDVAVQLMVQMRNKLLDSYSEIMRMNI